MSEKFGYYCRSLVNILKFAREAGAETWKTDISFVIRLPSRITNTRHTTVRLSKRVVKFTIHCSL